MKLKLITLFILLFFISNSIFSQKEENKVYRAEKDKIHNIIHTKLKVDFNFNKKQLNGEEWITLQPHFYATNKVTLDAKSMIIHQISLNNKTLEYHYDGKEIKINLPKIFTRTEEFTLFR